MPSHGAELWHEVNFYLLSLLFFSPHSEVVECSVKCLSGEPKIGLAVMQNIVNSSVQLRVGDMLSYDN